MFLKCFNPLKQACKFFFFSLSITGGSPDYTEMQSTSNHLWLLSDILGQGATANVFRGRHKVGAESSEKALYVQFSEMYTYTWWV